MIEHYKNLSLENISEEIDGILYIEEWKDIRSYEGKYQVSSFGRVKALPNMHGRHLGKEKILSQSKDTIGYLMSWLYKDGKRRTFKTHRLVALAFFGESQLKVDHLDEIKTNNRKTNLEYVTQRENSHRYYSRRRDLPVGVRRQGKRFYAVIVVKQKAHRLGMFDTPEEAHAAYNTALNDLENIDQYAVKFIPNLIKSWAAPYRHRFFRAMIRRNGRNKSLGTFTTEEEARRVAFRYEITFQNCAV